MAIAFVAATSASGASVTATTATITVPAGSTGEMLLIGVSCGSNATASADAPLISCGSVLPALLFMGNSVFAEVALYYRVVQAGDPSTYVFNVSTAAPLSVVAVRYSGVHATTPFRDFNIVTAGGVNTETVTSVLFPVLNNVQSTDMAVALAGMGVSTKTTTISAISTPASWTNRVTKTGPTASTAYPTTEAFFERLGGTDSPSVSGSTGQWHSISVALVDASNQVPDATGGTIAFVAATTAKTTVAATTSLAVNKPTGVVDGNLLILAVGASTSGTWTTPTGWTPMGAARGETGRGTTTGSLDVQALAYWKIAASEPASYTVTTSHSQEFSLAIVAYSGARSFAPVGLHGITQTLTALGTTSPTPYALPQVNADNLIVNLYMVGTDATGALASMTGPTTGGWTQRAQVLGAVTTDYNAGITIADKLGATDYPTCAASATGCWAVFSLAVVGAPAATSAAPRTSHHLMAA